jgi:hypothetical protein
MASDTSADAWRKQGQADTRIEQLTQLTPGTSDTMIQMGERFKNLYWAAKLNKWEFAEHQLKQMQGLLKKLQISNPEQSHSAQRFLDTALHGFPGAFQYRDWNRFSHAFESMRQRCMECHIKNNLAFITLSAAPPKGSSPVLFAD